MKRLCILNNDTCTYLTIEGTTSFHTFILEEIDNGICINGNHIIEKNQSIQILDYTLYLLETDWVWSMKKIDSFVRIGRDESNDIILANPSISNFHVEIEHGVIRDCNSTNGTYVNGCKISTSNLTNGDCIWIVDTCILYFDGFLILNKPLYFDEPSIVLKEEISYTISPSKNVPILIKKEFDLESFMSDGKIEKQGLFQSIGSSIMILFSSCVSLLIMYCIQPSQAIQLVSMVLMSLSMSMSFLFFGLYTRNYNWKKQKKEIEWKHSLYKQYLQSIENQIVAQREQVTLLNEEIKENCIYFKQSFQMYPVPFLGFEKQELFCLHYRNPGYQNVEHPLHQYVENWMQTQNVNMDVPVFFKEERQYTILYKDHIVDTLFLRLAYSRMHRKIVVVSKKEYAYITHPLCTYARHRLWIHDQHSFEAVYPLCDDTMVYIFEDMTYFDDLKSKCKYCLVINPNQGMDVFSYMDEFVYRQSLIYYTEIQDEINCVPFFTPQQDGFLHLNVCLGFDEKKEPIEIDFSEKGHGPHGLVAGSTGSGKSELLASLMMQLVLRNDANQVQFILIDFKGGALGNIFSHFPHFKGMVTNLEKKDIKRFLVNMEVIIEQRQMLLASFQKEYPTLSSHIDTYNQYRSPMAHLFIVVDELAQLKSHFPEVITKLKEIARIGRSLGIHLILSTQKPVGVVDDQIWANSTFQICLKVANVQDSKEILHSDKAAYLDKTGQFIFQSGPSIERKGTSLYLHQKIENPYTEVDEYDVPISYQTSKTILDSILENQRSIPNQWLILPSLNEYAFQNENIVYDDIYTLSQKEWKIPFGKALSIVSHDIQNLSKYLITYYQNECICTYKLDYDAYVDQTFSNFNDLFQIHQISIPCTLLVYAETIEDLNVWSTFSDNQNLRIILLMDHLETSYFKILNRISNHAHYHWMDKEWVYLYYASAINVRDSIDYENAICIDTRIYEMRLNTKKKLNKIQVSRLPIHKDSRIFLGFSKQHKEIYLDETRSLLICFVQKSVEEKIVELIKSCKDKKITTSIEDDFDICVLNLITDSSSLSSRSYMEKQFDMDVLWIGQGFMEYGYPLKRKCFETGVYDMIYFHKQECILLDWS